MVPRRVVIRGALRGRPHRRDGAVADRLRGRQRERRWCGPGDRPRDRSYRHPAGTVRPGDLDADDQVRRLPARPGGAPGAHVGTGCGAWSRPRRRSRPGNRRWVPAAATTWLRPVIRRHCQGRRRTPPRPRRPLRPRCRRGPSPAPRRFPWAAGRPSRTEKIVVTQPKPRASTSASTPRAPTPAAWSTRSSTARSSAHATAVGSRSRTAGPEGPGAASPGRKADSVAADGSISQA